ncbi:hypothetical protein AWB82_01160 [Caballeronia glebae]|uniref:Uncharacterized protein n=1 Tax=Caballeronia glebae TaxID=1777143 RepID=A0A157ZTX4_9BURK|nr:hypothetical protein AWB82_01160 [Caballeronia glebae]
MVVATWRVSTFSCLRHKEARSVLGPNFEMILWEIGKGPNVELRDGIQTKKSPLVRAGLQPLSQMSQGGDGFILAMRPTPTNQALVLCKSARDSGAYQTWPCGAALAASASSGFGAMPVSMKRRLMR